MRNKKYNTIKENKIRRVTPKTAKKGFALVEIVVCLFMIGITLLVYSAASNTMTLSQHSKYQEVALKIASSKIEKLRQTSFASLPASGTFTDTLLNTLQSGTATLTMTDLNSKTKQATVVVSWTEHGSSATRTVRLDTIITQGGLGNTQ